MRYLVEPKKRRAARNFLFSRILEAVSQRKDISFGSDTFAVSVSGTADQKDVLRLLGSASWRERARRP
jgi:hypothetical protein